MGDNSGAKYALSLNQDNSCFAVSTKTGFTIYSVDPFQELFSRRFPGDEISFVRMLYRTNILAIVTKGPDVTKPFSRLVIWDDHASQPLKEMDFPSSICGIRISKELIVVVRESNVHIFDFRNFSALQTLETVENKLGLINLAASAPRRVLACLGTVDGQVRVLTSASASSTLTSSPPINPGNMKSMAITVIQAHSTPIAALALNHDGTRLATASVKGTVVRVFNTDASQLLFELHRGSDSAVIYSVAFRFDSNYLVCSSNRGTVHVFSLLQGLPSRHASDADAASPPSTISSVVSSAASAGLSSVFSTVTSAASTVLPSFIVGQRSFAQLRIDNASGVRNVVAFCADDSTFITVTQDGHFYRASYGGGGECALIQNRTFVESSAKVASLSQPSSSAASISY